MTRLGCEVRIVTGGASRIGEATCQPLAQEGVGRDHPLVKSRAVDHPSQVRRSILDSAAQLRVLTTSSAESHPRLA